MVRQGFPGVRHFDRDSRRDPHGSQLPLPEPRSVQQDTGAVEYLLETLRSTTERITLVPVGPLSNIATVLTIDPSLVEAVEEVVVMGGGHAVANVTASAEFNIWADPEAAAVVFAAGFERLTLVTLDATYQAMVDRDTCTRLEKAGTPAATAAHRIISRRIAAYQGFMTSEEAAPVHDVVCTAYLVRPEVVSVRRAHVAVETVGPLTVGRTVVDTRFVSGQEPNADVALGADAELLARLLVETLG